jgi:hypothetical protein
MKIYFLRLVCVLFFVFFELSFFDVLFPWTVAPLGILCAAIAWGLVAEFPRALILTLPVALLFDIASAGMPGILTLYSVPLVYGVSFISKRFLLEQRGTGGLLHAVFAAGAVFGYVLFHLVITEGNMLISGKVLLMQTLEDLFSRDLLFSLLLVVLIFILVYPGLKRFEEYIGHASRREVVKMR